MKNPIQYSCLTAQERECKNEKTKNEMMREMTQACIGNALEFHFCLNALNEEDERKKRFLRVNELDLAEQTAVRAWFKGYAKEVLVVRQVF